MPSERDVLFFSGRGHSRVVGLDCPRESLGVAWIFEGKFCRIRSENGRDPRII